MKHHRLVAVIAVGAIAIAATGFPQPRFTPIPESTLLAGSPLHVPLDGIDPSGQALTYTAVASDPLVTATVIAGNRSLRIQVATYGTMVFQLFDGRVRRATNRIATLADSGFYNGVIFHRIINDAMLKLRLVFCRARSLPESYPPKPRMNRLRPVQTLQNGFSRELLRTEMLRSQ